MEKSKLSLLPISAKILVTCVVATLALGYSVSLLQVGNRGSFDSEKTIRHFRGSENPAESEVYVPQSDASMISVAHVHSFSQPVVLAIMGFLFVLTAAAEFTKGFWILLSFLGSVSMNLSPWLIRDVSPSFVYGLYFGGAVMLGAFCVMAVRILYDLWMKKEA